MNFCICLFYFSSAEKTLIFNEMEKNILPCPSMFVCSVPLQMRTMPLNGSSMCWRWRRQACRCSFICHFVLIYYGGYDRPPRAAVSTSGMLWCGERAGRWDRRIRTELDPPGEMCCLCPPAHYSLAVCGGGGVLEWVTRSLLGPSRGISEGLGESRRGSRGR